MRRTPTVAVMAAFAIAAAIAAPNTTAAASSHAATHTAKAHKHHAAKGKAKPQPTDHTFVGSDPNEGHALPIQAGTSQALAQAQAAAAANASVGDTKQFLALNDVTGLLYVKTYTLRGIGD